MANNANGNSNARNNTSSAVIQGCTQANISLIPEDLAFCIRRFLSDKDQPPPPGFKQAQNEAEAESKMVVQLRAFDEEFSNASERN